MSSLLESKQADGGPSAQHTVEGGRYREARRVTLVGSGVDLALGVAKIAVGLVAHSQALLADGIHSLSDLVTDAMVLWAAKHASAEADAEHPYGHARIETAMTVALGVSLILVAAGISFDAVRRLFEPELLWTPGWPALVVAAGSIVAKEWVYHYTMRVARRLRSDLLRANAWHSRSDAISSVIVLIGVAGAMAGLDYLDAVAAVGVAFMVAKIGWSLAWKSVRELIDTGLDAERLAAIRSTIEDVKGVRDLHMLRTRRMGADALVDVHILVDPKLSVSEGHQLSETVRHRLIDHVDEVTDVLVHIDPEDDETAQPCSHLPLRAEMLPRLRASWANHPWGPHIGKVTMHYLSGHVDVDIVVPLAAVEDLNRIGPLTERLEALAQSVAEVGNVKVYFH